MPVNIIEYKKTILKMFDMLTEIEIKTCKDIIKDDPEHKSDMGLSYILAVKRCRKLLKIILQGTTDE